MTVDVVITSCARPEMLERTVVSFMDNVKFSGNLRTILIEDFVEDEDRRVAGRAWIEANASMFDEVLVMRENVGPYKQFQNAASNVTAPYMFKLDDDAEFVKEIDLDAMVRVMAEDGTLAQLILRRKGHVEVNPETEIVAGCEVVVHDFYSISFGIHRMIDVRRLFGELGWDCEAHETGVLTPAAARMGMRCGIFGNDESHYRHVGGEMGFDKGRWK